MKAGILGLPGSGKSTLFDLLAETTDSADAAPKGHSPLKPRSRTVKVRDPRLERLRDDYQPKKYTPAALEILDFPALEGGADDRVGLSDLLAPAREVDALVLVVRDFKNSAIPRGDTVDPVGDLKDVRSELILADLASVERRLEKLFEKRRKPSYTDDDEKERGLLERVLVTLEKDQGVGAAGLNAEEQKRLSSFGFLSGKPFVTVLNSETGTHPSEELDVLRAIVGGEALAVAARSEREILELPEADRAVFLEEYGIQRFMRDPLIQAIYNVSGRISYFTAGDKEVRAWTILLGDTAPRAAGAIHTDFERGFIRAEVVSYEDYIRFGSVKGAKEKGHYRLEGREYVVKEADIVEFRFSV